MTEDRIVFVVVRDRGCEQEKSVAVFTERSFASAFLAGTHEAGSSRHEIIEQRLQDVKRDDFDSAEVR